MLIELLCAFVQRMYEQCSHTSVLGDILHTSYRILQQGGAQLEPLSASIHRQPRQHHHWHWIRHVATDSARGFRMGDCSRCQGVIPDYVLIGIDHNESAAGPV